MSLASALACTGQPAAINPGWHVGFPAAANGKASDAAAVPLNGESVLVSIVAAGGNPAEPAVRFGNSAVAAKMIGHDPVSRLGFFKVDGGASPEPVAWLEEAPASPGTPLQAMLPGGAAKCRSAGWVKQVGGKILPLALMRVNFDRAVPPAGTALLDESGRVAAIIFQATGSGNTGCAIPAEAVHRVWRDVSGGGGLVRGWLGLSLRAENQSPQIVRVLPGSPSAAAGIQPADVLLNVGPRQISDYADAVNAFFYLVPGQPVRVKLLRGADQLEFTITPARSAETANPAH